MSNRIEVQHYFDAAHQLVDSDFLITKACARLHGHTYAVKVTAEVDELNPAGMVIDFKAIKQVIDELDHRYINDVFLEKGVDLQPTAENIARVLCNWLELMPIKVTQVSVCEGYKGAERASWAVYTPEGK